MDTRMKDVIAGLTYSFWISPRKVEIRERGGKLVGVARYAAAKELARIVMTKETAAEVDFVAAGCLFLVKKA